MNKKDVAQALGTNGKPVSIRLVERYASEGRLGEVRYVRGKTGKVADFDPDAVETLKRELESVDVALEAPNRRATGLAVASPAGTLERFAELVAARLRPADTRPLWLTRAQAAEVSGLPLRWVDRAVADGRLRPIGRGHAWRVHRDDVLKLAESLRPDGEG